jgi:hypothetical protein
VSLSRTAFASISVTPAVPTESSTITIRVDRAFPFATTLHTTSVTQVGNTFHVQQNVTAGCFLPSSTLVWSNLPVGPLPPGTYHVVATMNLTGSPSPQCDMPPIVQTADFVVLAADAVPALDARSLFALGALLVAAAFAALRTR